MHLDSVKWIAFSCSEGLFEWKVMPFGLKNVPQIFQRKMDNIFGNYKEFTYTYINVVLFFFKTNEEHYLHLKQILHLFEKFGLIISKSKNGDLQDSYFFPRNRNRKQENKASTSYLPKNS